MQYRLRNKPKSIKIIAKSSSKNIFRWIFTYLYIAFDNVFLNIKSGKNKKNTLKNAKKHDLNKNNVKNVYYIYLSILLLSLSECSMKIHTILTLLWTESIRPHFWRYIFLVYFLPLLYTMFVMTSLLYEIMHTSSHAEWFGLAFPVLGFVVGLRRLWGPAFLVS